MNKKHLMSTCMLLLALLLLAGCGGDGAADNGVAEPDNPEVVVESWLQSLQKLEFEESKQYIASDIYNKYSEEVDDVIAIMEEDGEEAKFLADFIELTFSYMENEITGYEIDGDQAVVKVIEGSPDLELLYEMSMDRMFELLDAGEIDLDAMTEAENLEFTMELIRELISETDIVTEEVHYELVKEDSTWKISNLDFSDMF